MDTTNPRPHAGIPESVLTSMRDQAQKDLREWNRIESKHRDQANAAAAQARKIANDLFLLKAELNRRV